MKVSFCFSCYLRTGKYTHVLHCIRNQYTRKLKPEYQILSLHHPRPHKKKKKPKRFKFSFFSSPNFLNDQTGNPEKGTDREYLLGVNHEGVGAVVGIPCAICVSAEGLDSSEGFACPFSSAIEENNNEKNYIKKTIDSSNYFDYGF